MELRLHIKLIAALLTPLLACAALAASPQLSAIKQFPLDERTVYQIPIGRDVPTTLMLSLIHI